MTRYSFVWLLNVCLFLCTVPSHASTLPVIDLSKHPSGERTGDNYLYSRDYNETTPLKQVLADNPWQTPESGVTNRGFSDNSSWMAFTLKNPSQKDMRLVLEYVDASAQNIDVYYRKLDSQDAFQHIHYGFDLPVTTRSVSFYRPAFTLAVPKQTSYEVYIRIFQGTEMTMHCFTSFHIWQEQDFYRHGHLEMLSLVMLLCLEVFMGIAAVAIYYSTKDKLFLSYALFVLSAAGLFAGLSGLWGYFIMPNHYEIWMVVIKINLCQIMSLLFIRRFLNLKHYSKSLDQGILVLASLGAFGLLTNLMGYPNLSRMTADVIAMFFIFLIPLGLYAHRQGVKSALLFTLSWVIFIVGMALASMRLSGLIADTYVTQWMIYIGGFIEIILLASIMVLRLHNMEKEKTFIQKRLDIALADAQENNQIKDKFLGVFSHELRTPLNGILGSLQLLGFSSLTDEQKQQKETASRAAKHLLRMVENILTFSELTSQKARSTLHDVNINTNIQGILNSFQRNAQTKNLVLQSNISPDTPHTLKLDWPNIQKILTYWLDNAIKFSHKGVISINVDCEPLDDKQSYQVTFHVIDQGPGIQQDTLQQIQKGFDQNNINTIKNIEGLGLGLANSIQIAELIHAHCRVSSSAQGTQYTLNIIAHKAELPKDHETQHRHDHNLVLAVDDNPINLMVLTQILTNNGLDVDEAKDGIEALEMVKQKKYQTIFMDCQMPRMDGYEATRCIRESDNLNSNTPIIAVTANAYDSDREHCLYVGMNDFISKPIDQTKIMTAFKRWNKLN